MKKVKLLTFEEGLESAPTVQTLKMESLSKPNLFKALEIDPSDDDAYWDEDIVIERVKGVATVWLPDLGTFIFVPLTA